MNAPVTDMPILLLAAGRSSRMRGIDKLLQEVEGKPLIRRQADIARAVTSGAVIVALPEAPHPRYDALAGAEVVMLPVPEATEGMNASLRTGIAALPPDADAAMLLLCDLPELTQADLAQIAMAHDPDSDTRIWRGTTQDGRPGHPIVFSAKLFDLFRTLTGDGGGREVVKAAGAHVVHIPLPGNRARLDLDTPEDWADWRAARGLS
ncbi:nucleotidyltransferase family protein [Sedimentitalea todarodis]|uniref:Nucleotidyltransferase family protein n=1 Tax=Sedimentitalea todarodis TaxID=1631240 RepID=A0ABU3VBY3_9RHOB|nr:nucleotidyltransferase family protein [Sedimentitalea todarodis]MDU9003687.1 nucleotidyltransferase family protein [Sedimentitalea todarodis]